MVLVCRVMAIGFCEFGAAGELGGIVAVRVST